MKSLENRLNRIANNDPNREPCIMVFEDLNGSYRIGKKTLSESELNELENDKRVIVLTPLEQK